jgi:cytochrome c-type biogenesis protein CcmH
MTRTSSPPVWRWAVLGIVAVVAALALAVVLARGPESPLTMQERVHQIASGLRCPVCQNLSVADSSSTLAHQMRTQIARDLREGKSPDEIRASFVASYGDWILLAPPRRGINVVAWAAPVVLLLGGAAAAAIAVRRWNGRRVEAPRATVLSVDDRRLLDRELSTVRDEPE